MTTPEDGWVRSTAEAGHTSINDVITSLIRQAMAAERARTPEPPPPPPRLLGGLGISSSQPPEPKKRRPLKSSAAALRETYGPPPPFSPGQESIPDQ